MTVYLVGAGPGDPGLVTLRAAALLARATTVVHDRLIGPGVLALASPSAALVDVGKRGGGGPSARQEEINRLLVEAGRREEVVVRLKGGDPFVFGRGGEEALALAEAGVAYEVVPGVSAAVSAAAAAGVPLTHRGVSSAFAVVSGHGLDAAAGWPEDADVDWGLLGGSSTTLVVLMGASTRALVAERLLAAGRPASTPVVVVERATMPTQATTRTTLGELASVEVESPATIVVGPVAGLWLASYEDRRLAGRRVVVTREASQAGPLSALLADEGAAVVEVPTRKTAPPADGGAALVRAVRSLATCSWVVVASPNAVEALWGAVRDARDLAGPRLAAVGSATARALGAHGLVADLVGEPGPGEGAAAALLARFPRPDGRGQAGQGRVLLPRAVRGRDELADGLAGLGWSVEAVDAYESIVPPADEALVRAVESADAVLFASPSAVDGFLRVAGPARMPAVAVTIGPTTSAALRAKGITVAAEAATPSVEGLVAAVVRALKAL